MSDLIKEAITEYWGEKCPDFNANCPTCKAWAEIEQLQNEVKTWQNHAKTAIWSDSEECKLLSAEVEKLTEAIENAQMASAETQPSWKHRCYRIMGALGIDCGDPDWLMPDERREITTLRAEVERLQKAMGDARVVWGEARDCLLKKITEVSAENERLRAGLKLWRDAYEQRTNEPLVIAYECTAALKGESDE